MGIFTARCTLVQSAVLRSHVVSLVCLSGVGYTEGLLQAEVLAGGDRVAPPVRCCWKTCCRPESLPIATGSAVGVAALRNCLEGESSLRSPRDSTWAPRVEWSVAHCCSGRLETGQVSRWWQFVGSPWCECKPRGNVT